MGKRISKKGDYPSHFDLERLRWYLPSSDRRSFGRQSDPRIRKCRRRFGAPGCLTLFTARASPARSRLLEIQAPACS